MEGSIDWESAYKDIVDGTSQQELITRIKAGGLSLAAGLSVHMSKTEHKLALLRAITNITVNNRESASEIISMLTDKAHFESHRDFYTTTLQAIDGKRIFIHLLINVANQSDGLKLCIDTSHDITTSMPYIIDQSLAYFFDVEHMADHDLLQKIEKGEKIDEAAQERAAMVGKMKDALKRYDEWMYLFVDGVLEEKFKIVGEGSQLEKLIRTLDSNIDTENMHLKPLPPKILHFLEYIFHLLQKTVEYKIHYSVIKEVTITSLDKDDFYSASKSTDKSGLRIGMTDFMFIKDSFEKAVDHFIGLTGSTEDSDHLVYIHILIKLLIPITFIGGYNSEIQKQLIPTTLDKLPRLIEFVHNHYYKPKVAINKEAVYCLNTNIVRLAGNLVHVNREAQDYLMENNLVGPLLKYTLPDANNPLSRESSIVFIRYMSESNPQAAAYIKSKNVFDLDSDSNKLFTKETFM